MALNREARGYFLYMRTTFTSILLGLFWIVWAPCAFIKDAVALLAVPFDTQRLVNTYIQTIRNAQALGNIWDPVQQTPIQQVQPGFRKIGFEGAPPHQPDQISGPVC